MDPEEPIDLSPFLLHPPPSIEQQARRAQTQRIVRWGSVAATAVIAIILLVPLGRGASGEPARTNDDTSFESLHDDQVSNEIVPRRVDVAPRTQRPRRARRAASRATTQARVRSESGPAPIRSFTPATQAAEPPKVQTASSGASSPAGATSGNASTPGAGSSTQEHQLDQSAQFDG